ncbi:type II secretion system protein [Chitinolyticbacter albus]|uniref:type II secretion system protein n=1 Tax=Chitinolyticbacter albus TaxID=2961951 RepID=UPI00210D3FEB|nr:type II secretion system protein [Chitinolyticbacter albus]
MAQRSVSGDPVRKACGSVVPYVRQTGFAYLFLLFTLLLFALSALLVVEVDATHSRREREQELLFIGGQFRAALRSYHRGSLVGGQGEYPRELVNLLSDPRSQTLRRHLRKIYRDPIVSKAEWGLLLQNGRIVCIYSLSELKPIKQDGFEPDDASFKHAASYRDWAFCDPADRRPPVAVHDGQPSAMPAKEIEEPEK